MTMRSHAETRRTQRGRKAATKRYTAEKQRVLKGGRLPIPIADRDDCDLGAIGAIGIVDWGIAIAIVRFDCRLAIGVGPGYLIDSSA